MSIFCSLLIVFSEVATETDKQKAWWEIWRTLIVHLDFFVIFGFGGVEVLNQSLFWKNMQFNMLDLTKVGVYFSYDFLKGAKLFNAIEWLKLVSWAFYH